jgi:hypothetical protein
MQQGHRGFLPIPSHVLESAGQEFGDSITNWVVRNNSNLQTVVVCAYVVFRELSAMLRWNTGVPGFPLPLREIGVCFRFSKI